MSSRSVIRIVYYGTIGDLDTLLLDWRGFERNTCDLITPFIIFFSFSCVCIV